MGDQRYPTIAKVRTLEPRGPWTTKSGSRLSVLIAHPLDAAQDVHDGDGSAFANAFVTAQSFLTYDDAEVRRLPHDLRGLRIYLNDRMPKGGVGGLEFHRIRQEFIMSIAGRVRWTSEDVDGATTTVVLTPGTGVYIPPWILHTYEVEEEGSALLVFCNTLYTPRCPDTYTMEEFRALQEQVRAASSPAP